MLVEHVSPATDQPESRAVRHHCKPLYAYCTEWAWTSAWYMKSLKRGLSFSGFNKPANSVPALI
eukprot:40629-Pelagomonas_calceolata.AAC.1